MLRRLTLLACSAMLVTPPTASAITNLTPIGTYSQPIYVTSDPDDPDRVFVVEQAGTVKLTTSSGTSTFLDLTDRVLSANLEQGLLSIAFAPDFADSGLLYAFYTGTDSGHLYIDEFTAEGDSVDPDSRRHILSVNHSNFDNHNGGQLQFGPDGYLYISVGDGGGGRDPLEAGQDLILHLGKLLRIDPRPGVDGRPYTVPPDNPFAAEQDPPPGAREEIWAYGLRNPWRFSFDRLTGDLLIGDVGQNQWEEIDYAPRAEGGGRGANYGWDCREGMHDFELTGCKGGLFTDPVLEYEHGGGYCSITGGYVVRDPHLVDLYGRYVYADWCVGQVRSVIPDLPLAAGDRPESIGVLNPVSFGAHPWAGLALFRLDRRVRRRGRLLADAGRRRDRRGRLRHGERTAPGDERTAPGDERTAPGSVAANDHPAAFRAQDPCPTGQARRRRGLGTGVPGPTGRRRRGPSRLDRRRGAGPWSPLHGSRPDPRSPKHHDQRADRR